MHKPTIHNPTNFNPADYEINGYFDNRPPVRIFGMDTEKHKQLMQDWEEMRDELFPDHNDHECQHCGQPNVRFVISCLHKPSDKNICLGDICVSRLNFPDYDEFQAARVRSEAAARAKEYKKGLKREQFLKDHPDFAEAFEKFNKTPEKFNKFAHNIVDSFNQWGNLFDNQVKAFINALEWKDKFGDLKAKQRKTSKHVGEVGKQAQFTATITFAKQIKTKFGETWLTNLEDSKGNVLVYWGELGTAGEKLSFKAYIKKHDEYDGVKQTVISYVKLPKEKEEEESDAPPF